GTLTRRSAFPASLPRAPHSRYRLVAPNREWPRRPARPRPHRAAMSRLEALGLKALRRIDPETAHGFAIRALRFGLASAPGSITSPRLRTNLAGLDLPNPLGLAAGFDKNAVAIAPLLAAGFGFIEVGAATPLPQNGNPRPRLFRLADDRAVINRFGFNNEGLAAITPRLTARPRTGVVGLNLGANKNSPDRAADF